MKLIGYARESTDKQELGLAAQVTLLHDHGCTTVIQDGGQSGATNLTESEKWAEVKETLRTGDTLVLVSQSRLGRTSYEVQYVVGKLIERGVAVEVLDDGRTYRDLDNFDENAMLALRSLGDHSERVDIKRRTKKALGYLSSNGVKLGPKPKLTDSDVERIRHLHAEGLGYQAISRAVRKEAKDGRLKPISMNTVKRALAGDYLTREEWHAHNDRARQSMGRVREAVRRIDAKLDAGDS